jgi:hypothetical protein
MSIAMLSITAQKKGLGTLEGWQGLTTIETAS